jgi:hypothetical protein
MNSILNILNIIYVHLGFDYMCLSNARIVYVMARSNLTGFWFKQVWSGRRPLVHCIGKTYINLEIYVLVYLKKLASRWFYNARAQPPIRTK